MLSEVLRKLGRVRAIASAILPGLLLVGAGLLGGLALPAPAAAQFQSEGYKFLKAVEDREGDVATEMLNQPGTTVINTRDITNGRTGLHIVVERSDIQWVRFLLQRGADPNIRNKKGVTPLQLATAMNFADAVEELVKKGANVNVSDQTGETPLIAAVHQRNVAMVRLLLDKGADPDRNDNSGRSARDYVELMNGNTLLVQEFQKADAKRVDAGTKRDYGPSF